VSVKNWIGIVLCVVLFAATFLVADGALQFLNGFGLLIVLSGTLGATLLSYPWSNFRNAIRVGWNSYFVRPPTAGQIVRNLIEISVHSRFEGILSLEKFEKQTTVSFLRSALEMLVDGYRIEEIRQILDTERAHFQRRREQHERVFRHMARLAPAFGVAGSVIGLMGMLFGIGDTGVILRTIPLALTSTLYGIVISNFVLTPIAESIHFKTTKELLIKKLVVDGVVAVLAEQNPHRLERRLESFLTPSARGTRRSLEEIRERYRQLRAERETA
jgi:chemotaxis protein MotA